MARFAVISGSAALVEAAGRATRSRPKSRSLPQVHGFRPGITARSCCSFNFFAIRGYFAPRSRQQCSQGGGLGGGGLGGGLGGGGAFGGGGGLS